MQVVWTVAARDDLRAIRDYIRQFNPAAARRIAIALVAAADSLTELPERGRPAGTGRREVVSIWPYVIRYQVLGDRVVILRVRHGRQRPD